MAVTITDHRTILNEADAITNWTGSPVLFTADPDPVELTGCIGYAVSTTTLDAYVTVGATDLSNKLVYVWAFPRGAMDSVANGGVGIHLGDGTDRISFHLAGKDLSAFTHLSGPVGWQCLLMDTSNPPATITTRAGSLASLTYTAITQVGATFKTLAKSTGGVSNCFVDVIRYGDPTLNNGCMFTVTGGTSGTPGKFSEIVTADVSTASGSAYGMIRELGTGLYGIQAPVRFGNSAGTSSSWFEETNTSLVFENRGLATTRYKIVIVDNGTGTTTFKLGTKNGTGSDATGSNGCNITVPTGVGGEFDAATDTDVTDVFIYGSTISGFTNGVKFRSPQEWAGNTFNGCGTIEPNGAYMVNCSISGSTATRALLWNNASDTDTRLDGCSFVRGTTGHGIELGASTPSSITLRNVTFSGYAGSDGSTGNEALYNNSGKNITVYIVGGTTPSIRNGAGASTTVIANPVTVSIDVQTVDGVAIENSRVLVVAAAGGPMPFNVTVTIVNSGTTATVTHSSHGLSTNDKVQIKGASHLANNGVFTITVTGTNTYTYTMGSAPGSNPTGTIKSTFAVLSGLTDVNGNISMSRVFASNQPITGRARKSTGSPLYKTSTIVGTISSSTGFSTAVPMIEDE